MKILNPKITLIFVLVPLLSGCATITKETCVMGDWHNLGFEAFGKRDQFTNSLFSVETFSPTKNLQKFVSTCTGHNVEVNQSEYWDGYKVAANTFCKYEKGYSVAISDFNIPYACTEEHSAKYDLGQDLTNFNSGYRKGQQAYCKIPNATALGESGAKYNEKICEDDGSRSQFLAEYTAGLAEYCTFERGFEHAKLDKPQRSGCLSNEITEYSAGYTEVRRIQRVEEEYRALIVRRTDLKRELKGLRGELGDLDLTNESSEAIKLSIEVLQDEYDDLRLSILSYTIKYDYLEIEDP